MGRYNLLDEPWISVFEDQTDEKKDVSMLEFFRNAASYRSLAGEMETQNFAVMRFLLSVVQTVFSRVNFDGQPLSGITLDEKGIQTEPVDSDDLDDYCEETAECWEQLYASGRFPDVLIQYLETWRDRFYLFDDQHPFYQVNKNEMDAVMAQIKKGQPTSIYGKNLNRTISESENKTALFSPIANGNQNDKRGRKDILSGAELVRWLLTFQGYTGLMDKVSLVENNQRPSKGWLFDIGGIYLRGSNLFETLILNYMPESPTGQRDGNYCGRVQKPCWESDGLTVVRRICANSFIDNLAELYTNWSRAVYINPKTDLSKPIEINVVKLPEIEHTEANIEPMTLWRRNDTGPNKDHDTPRKHKAEEALWRSFGIIAMGSADSGNKDGGRQPGIFGQYDRLIHAAGSRWTDLAGVSMEDNGQATSWLPVDEITDSFRINDLVITDSDPDGWVVRINDTVETTKHVISGIYYMYLKGICEIRSLKVTSPMDAQAVGFIHEETAIMYAVVDTAFKNWLSQLQPGDSKEEKIKSWYSTLRKLVLARGEELFEQSTSKDLTGIKNDSGVENIATKYWQFVNSVNSVLYRKGGQA